MLAGDYVTPSFSCTKCIGFPVRTTPFSFLIFHLSGFIVIGLDYFLLRCTFSMLSGLTGLYQLTRIDFKMSAISHFFFAHNEHIFFLRESFFEIHLIDTNFVYSLRTSNCHSWFLSILFSEFFLFSFLPINRVYILLCTQQCWLFLFCNIFHHFRIRLRNWFL